MENEIKEILRDLEFASGVFDYTITPDRCTFLKDYIINLQKELAFIKKGYKKVVNSNDDNIVIIYKALDKLYCYEEVFDREILQQFQKEMKDILRGVSDE